MNKSELISSMAEKSGMSKKDSESALNATIESIQEALTQGNKVQLIGFGTFEVKKRTARKGRNPQTGTEINIPERNATVFKAGKDLKDLINQ